MFYKKFSFTNFKGIQNISIDITNGEVNCIVGLNESGKTTILEAINICTNLVKNKVEIKNGKSKNLIPRSKIDNFSNEISLECTIELDSQDLELCNAILTQEMTTINTTDNDNKEKNSIEISYKYKFNSSNLETSEKLIKLNNLKKINDTIVDNNILSFIAKYAPDVLFYEDFLEEIPKKFDITFQEIIFDQQRKKIMR